ncbi:MAG: response regulator [Anaerolineae bacterium]|nr:response regulator [Anaerolineae bacterium]
MPEKILIVDDDVDSLKLIGLMLQRNGYEVIAAHAGNQAITKAMNELPDLIILDVMMPDMNGYDVCRRLRANATTQDIPIIMFTAKTLIDDKVAGFEAGADDYLTKPTHPAELASRVRAILQRSSSKKQSGSSKGATIGVLGVKGGIGATTVTLNLGASLIQMKASPVVADFRLGIGSLGATLGLGQSNGMSKLLSRPANEITSDAINKEIATHQSGLRVLSCSTKPREGLVVPTPDTAIAIIKELRNIGKPTIFDLGSGFNPLVSHIYPEMDRLIILVDPATVTLNMARDLLQELAKGNRDKIHLVVVNRAQINLQPPWHEVEHLLEHEIRAIISPSPELAYQAMESGVPMVSFQPNAIVSSQLNKLAEDVYKILEAK